MELQVIMLVLAFGATVLTYEVPSEHAQYIGCLIQKFMKNEGYYLFYWHCLLKRQDLFYSTLLLAN